MHTFGSTIWRETYALYPLHEMICVLTFTPWPTESSVEKRDGCAGVLILASLFLLGGQSYDCVEPSWQPWKQPISLRATFSLCMSTVCIQAQIFGEELLLEISKTHFEQWINIPNLHATLSSSNGSLENLILSFVAFCGQIYIYFIYYGSVEERCTVIFSKHIFINNDDWVNITVRCLLVSWHK